MVTAEALHQYCETLAKNAKQASGQLAHLPTITKNQWLISSAQEIENSVEQILEANAQDIAAAPGYGLDAAAIDRLKLDAKRIGAIARALAELADLPDPIGEIIEGGLRPNGLEIQKVRVPLGTVLFIYESRPNVTVDAAGICVKSGNAVILRGGKEAWHSSQALVDILCRVGQRLGLPEHAVQFVQSTDRAAVGYFLALSQFIDVAIPRGGKSLIERVVAEARMPVIKHFDGNCHVFVDRSADSQMAVNIVVNAKCQRMGVCNACESLLIHHAVANSLLPSIASALQARGIELRGDPATCQIIPGTIPAKEDDWYAEYLGPIISIKIVRDVDDAIDHINRYGSHHTDAIVTNDLSAARRFTTEVDSSAVMVNASTRFNDGGEFGMGAEIGISTDKLHARGPCGLRELTTYKYIVLGNGQIRT